MGLGRQEASVSRPHPATTEHWSPKGSRDEKKKQTYQISPSRKILTSRNKGNRGYRAIAHLSVTAKWYPSVIVLMLHDTKNRRGGLHLGAERGVNCEHLQVLVTAFDVVKPGIIAEILKETGGHEWMSAALLAGGDEEPQGKGMSNLARRNADTHDVSGKEARKVPSG